MSGNQRLTQIQALLKENPQETSAALLALVREQYGDVGFLLRTLAEEEPETFIRYTLDAERLLGAHRALDAKTGELVAIAAATASQCDHCIKAHIGSARANGATWEEILDTILIAAHTAESSALAIALRSYKQEKARHRNAQEVEE